MKYLLFMMTDESAESALAPAGIEAIVAQHTKVMQELRDAGKLVASKRLCFSPQAVTLRVQGDRRMVTDGPFAETKEQLGGFYLIDADSKAEAIEWAKKLPLREVGAVEVRPARTGAQWRGAIRGAHEFMVMFIGDVARPHTRDEMFRSIDTHYEVSLELAAQGKFVGSRALEPPAAATTLRWHDGGHLITDGPFAETKEFVAGYFMVSCDSKAEAVDWAQRLVGANQSCEVRPVWPST